MKTAHKLWTSFLFAAVAVLVLPAPVFAQHYAQTNLVSNVPGRAPVTDPNLRNPWGLVASPTSPWWIANNSGGTSTLYSSATTPATVVPLVVAIPNAPSQPPPGSPTGVVFNGSPTDFLLAPGKQSVFLFATEDGTIQGWNPGVNRTVAVIKVDNSQNPTPADGAVYKGATIAEIDGQKFILASNFRSGRVDIFDSNFRPVRIAEKGSEDDRNTEEAFTDDRIPEGFAPFNVQGIGPNIYVTYAKQDAVKHDPVGGTGLGFVDVFTPKGKLVQRLQHGPWFNAPWGIVWSTPNFGEFSNTILVGNFRGGGTIAAFNPVTGRFIGNMLNPDGTTLSIDGLWALRFGSGIPKSNSAPGSSLFFTAGPDGEVNGLFGTLTPAPNELGDADEQ